MLVRIIGGHGGVSPGFRATSYLIDSKILIDAGSVASGIPISEQVLIENILISHPHLDHISDLAFLSDNCFGLKQVPFEVYCNGPVRAAIKQYLMNDVIWPDFSKLPSETNPTIHFNDMIPEQPIMLGDYKILPVRVNHQNEAVGFIIEKGSKAILFTQDTGPTERIWELGKQYKNLRGIFTEVSFPNHLQKVADISLHLTPKTIAAEILKMPADVPVFCGHLKPNYQDLIYKELEDLKNDRINVIGSDDANYIF